MGEFKIRGARPKDVPALAELVTQLGYPSGTGAVGRRLEELLGREDHLVAVAESAEGREAEGRVVGLLHARVRPNLLSDGVVEIASLVVEEGWRGRGIGRLLLARLEGWAGERGCGRIQVHSNAVRQRAHAFYAVNGFHKVKESVALEKTLDATR
ncbi:MAG: GNAT family N-acetyltransferase [Methanocella sp.]